MAVAGETMIRIGVDFGGTKIEAAGLGADGAILARHRLPNPGAYDLALATVRALVDRVAAETGAGAAPVGVAVPGSISPRTGLMRNANSQWLNDRPFDVHLAAALERPVRLENDANCFALSEATDGAAAGAAVVFGAILGTGCGGGLVVGGKIIEGANRIAGEWGHTPLPWASPDEHPGPLHWCGRHGCLEGWISGSGFEADFVHAGGALLDAKEIVEEARAGEPAAVAALDRYLDRLGRGLALICDILDPDVIVLGGGMSNTDEIYARVPAIAARHAFSDVFVTRIVKARYGDSSGVRGAAWLWP